MLQFRCHVCVLETVILELPLLCIEKCVGNIPYCYKIKNLFKHEGNYEDRERHSNRSKLFWWPLPEIKFSEYDHIFFRYLQRNLIILDIMDSINVMGNQFVVIYEIFYEKVLSRRSLLTFGLQSCIVRL